MRVLVTLWLLCFGLGGAVEGVCQGAQPSPTSSTSASMSAPLPDVKILLQAVEQNQRRLEAEERDYTYHVHTESAELDKQGGVKRTEVIEAESLTIDGVRVDRVVARNGKALTDEEKQKESERIDKVVAKAKERRARAGSKGAPTDPSGNPEISLSRILELGTFTNSRREAFEGRPTILLDYKGDPNAKTQNAFETAFRDLTGTIWIDEADKVLVRGQGQLVNDFKLGGGLLADVRKGTSFDFRAHRVNDEVWLPATIDARGSVRIFLLASFNGRTHLATSDYRRFRTSATIMGSHGVIGEDGTPVPDPAGGAERVTPGEPKPDAPAAPQP